MNKIFYSQIILSYVGYAFIAIYYNVIDKEHIVNMDWWAIGLLVVATMNIFLAEYLLNKRINEPKQADLFEKILKQIVKFPLYILFLPFIIIGSLIYLVISLGTSTYLISKPLRQKGFKYKSRTKPWIVYLVKENINIKFSYESYQISFDQGNTYINIIDSDLGSIDERNNLKDKVIEYIGANPLDRQRGDVVDPLYDFIIFLDKYLE